MPPLSGRTLVTDLADDLWTRTLVSVLDGTEGADLPTLGRGGAVAAPRTVDDVARAGDVEIRRVWTARKSTTSIKHASTVPAPESWARTLVLRSTQQLNRALRGAPQNPRTRGRGRKESGHRHTPTAVVDSSLDVGDAAEQWHLMDAADARRRRGYTAALQDLPTMRAEVFVFVNPDVRGSASTPQERATVAVPLVGIGEWCGIRSLDATTDANARALVQRLREAARSLAPVLAETPDLAVLQRRRDGPVFVLAGAAGAAGTVGGLDVRASGTAGWEKAPKW